jgi:plasmid maintenance system antidote protein VapI
MRSLRNPNRKPTHPGAVLRADLLPELGWTQGELATRPLVSHQTVSDLSEFNFLL